MPITSVPGSAVYSAVREGGTDGVHDDRLERQHIALGNCTSIEKFAGRIQPIQKSEHAGAEDDPRQTGGLCGIRTYASCS